MSRVEHARYVFKKNFIIGSGVLYLGLWVSNQTLASSISGWICSLLGGFVIGFCYKKMLEHTLVSTPHFYDYVVRRMPEQGRYYYWRIRLFMSLSLTSLCLVLALSVISLPIGLQLITNQFAWWYFILLILIYRRIGTFVKMQYQSWKLIKQKALAFEQTLIKE